MSGFKKVVNEGQAAEKNKPNQPNWKKLALIISPFVLILIIVVIVIFSQNGKSNESQAVDNQVFESIIAPCPFRRVDDTLAFLRLQLDSLYTVADTRERKAQQYDCICQFLPQAKAEGRLTIAEEGGNSRNKLLTHLQSPAAKCLQSLKIEFEPANSRPQNVLIEAALTNMPLYQASNNKINQNTPVVASDFRLPTAYFGTINGSRAQLNLSQLNPQGDEITFRFNLLSPANPQDNQQGSISTSTKTVRLNRVGVGRFEHKGDKLILNLEMETIVFESTN